MRMLKLSLKLLSSFLKMSVIFAFFCILVKVASDLCIIVCLHCSGYSDEGLYLAAKECVVNTVGVLGLNDEVEGVFSDSCWAELSASSFYDAPNGGCLDKVRRTLPSSGNWSRAMFDGRHALVFRFGCHFNYAWLVIVDPKYCIRYGDDRIKRIADNIGVCSDSGILLDCTITMNGARKTKKNNCDCGQNSK